MIVQIDVMTKSRLIRVPKVFVNTSKISLLSLLIYNRMLIFKINSDKSLKILKRAAILLEILPNLCKKLLTSEK